MVYTVVDSNIAGGPNTTWFWNNWGPNNSSNNAGVYGWTTPQTNYNEILFRTDAATQSVRSGGCSQPSCGYFDAMDFFGSGTGQEGTNNSIEWDTVEWYTDGGVGMGNIAWGSSCNGGVSQSPWSGQQNPSPGQQYHAYGAVQTIDASANMSVAYYFDGTLGAYGTWNACYGDTSVNWRDSWGFGIGEGNAYNGPNTTPPNGPYPISANMTSYIQHVQFWFPPSCPASVWQNGACNVSAFNP